MSSDPLSTVQFTGHRGIVVESEGDGPTGELDPSDVVRPLRVDNGVRGRYEPELGDELGAPVAWGDESYVEARADFARQLGQANAARARQSPLDAAIKRDERPAQEEFRRIISELTDISGALDAPSDASPWLRSHADLGVSLANKALTEHYNGRLWSLKGRIRDGKASYQHVQRAFQVSPENPDSVFGYTMAVIALYTSKKYGVRLRSHGEERMQVDVRVELARLIPELERHITDVRCQVALVLALQSFEQTTRNLDADLAEREERVASLVQERMALGAQRPDKKRLSRLAAINHELEVFGALLSEVAPMVASIATRRDTAAAQLAATDPAEVARVNEMIGELPDRVAEYESEQ